MFEVYTENIKIIVIGKISLKAKHIKEIEARIKSYEELPDFTLTEFTKMTTGLLSNVALKAFSVIRQNTFKVLTKFNNKLDAAFLSHKALLPTPEDASQQVLDIIGSDVKSLINNFETAEQISPNSINDFLDGNIIEPVKIFFSEREKFKAVNIPETISRNNLKTIVNAGVEKYFLKKVDPQEEILLFQKNCHKNLTDWFVNDPAIAQISDINFAKLTTIKSIYNNNYIPILSQGTVVATDDVKSEYWLCIQPKCDSVRIETRKRDFLLIRLIKTTKDKFDIIFDDDIFLRLDYSIYQSKLVSFKILEGSVSATIGTDGKKRFEKNDNLKMIWIGELKSDYAQSITNNFAAGLARVGMDHSEWLRRSS